MDKKHFNIEERIRHAAAEETPAFNEAAWEKMQALLDRGKDNRPILPFLLWGTFAVLLIFSALLLINKFFLPTKSNPEVGLVAVTKISNPTIPHSVPVPSGAEPQTSSINDIIVSSPRPVVPAINRKRSPSLSIQSGSTNISKYTTQTKVPTATMAIQNKPIPSEKSQTITIAEIKSDVETKAELQASSPPTKVFEAITTNKSISEATMHPDSILEKKVAKQLSDLEKDKITRETQETKKTVPNAKKRTSLLSNIFVQPSGGMGIDATNFRFSNGRIKPKYGFSLGYQINEQTSLTAGVSWHDKVYEAIPGDYKTTQPYWATVYITEIDADCKVVELPLIFNYTFLTKSKLKLAAHIGVVSFVMKSEEYNYYYLRNGVPYNRKYNYNTGKTHIAATLLMGTSVAAPINKKLLLFAMPAVATPINGIGEGRVNLYSLQLMTGLQYFPFRKK